MVGGICSGFAEAIGISPTPVRIAVALMFIFWNYLAIVYFLLAIVMPEAESAETASGPAAHQGPLITPGRLMMLSTVFACVSCGIAITRNVFGIRNIGILTIGFFVLASGLAFLFDALTLRSKLLSPSRAFFGMVLICMGVVMTLAALKYRLEWNGSSWIALKAMAASIGPPVVVGVFINLLFPSRWVTASIWVALFAIVLYFLIQAR